MVFVPATMSLGEMLGWIQTVADQWGITTFVQVGFLFLIVFMVVGWFVRRGD